MLPGATPQSRPAASRVVHVSNAHVSGGVYCDPRPSTRLRKGRPLVLSVSARVPRTFRQSAGLVKRGLSREAGSVPMSRGDSPSRVTEGFAAGCPAGDGSCGPMSGVDSGSSGPGSVESSGSASERLVTSSSVAVSDDSDCAANSATTILVIRMPEEAFRDVTDPGESGAAPIGGPASGDGVMAREKTKAWIAIDAAMEATMTRRLSLRRVSTLVRSAADVTACRSSPGPMLAPAREPAGCLTLSIRCDSLCGEEVVRLPRDAFSSARRTGCRSRPRWRGAG